MTAKGGTSCELQHSSFTEIEQLVLVLTGQCNLNCSYCYQDHKQDLQMDWQTLRTSIDLALAARRDGVELIFSGGEPLLEFSTIARAVAYIDRKVPEGKSLKRTIFTNGILLDEKVLEFVVGHDFKVQLSFDGVPTAQDFRCPATFPLLDKLLTTMRCRSKAFFSQMLRVVITVIPAGIQVLSKSVEYFIHQGVKEIGIAPAITYQPDWGEDQEEELKLQFENILRASIDHFKSTNEVPVALLRKNPREFLGRPETLSLCDVAQGTSLTIDVDGEVYGCASFIKSLQSLTSELHCRELDPLRMGNVRDPCLGERYRSFKSMASETGIFMNKREKYSVKMKCSDCPHLITCAICPLSIGYLPGNTDANRVPDFQCSFNYIAGEYRKRFPYFSRRDGSHLA